MAWTPAFQSTLDALPATLVDVYFTSAYHALHAADGEPWAFVHEAGEHRLVVPGLRVAIEGTDLADLQTPNGYGGPLLSPGAPEDFVAEAGAAFAESAKARGIVAAFFRMHPLLGS